MQKNILDGIGNTPMFDFSEFSEELGISANIFAKLEKFNPQGSIKDRVAKYMIDDAMASGKLKKGGTIVEPTSGNTGIGLAYVGKQMGISVILTMPESMSVERVKFMQALGAQVVLTDKSLGMGGAIAMASKLAEEIEGCVLLDQFANLANPRAHAETTAPEIFLQMNKKIDVFICGIGTGGTISGVGKFLKNTIDGVEIFGVEPASSAVLSGEKSGAHKIQGIGAGFVPKALDLSVVDSVMKITDEEAFDGLHEIAKVTSMLVGISSGCAFAAAKKLAKMEKYRGKNIVTIFPDGGEKYFSVEGYL